MYRHILVTLDHTGASEAFLTRLIHMAQPLGSTVHVLCIFPPAGATLASAPMAGCAPLGEHSATHYLHHVATRFRNVGLFVSMDVRWGEPVETILATARQVGADLIAMTTASAAPDGHGSVSHIAAQVIRRAPVTVILDECRYATVNIP